MFPLTPSQNLQVFAGCAWPLVKGFSPCAIFGQFAKISVHRVACRRVPKRIPCTDGRPCASPSRPSNFLRNFKHSLRKNAVRFVIRSEQIWHLFGTSYVGMPEPIQHAIDRTCDRKLDWYVPCRSASMAAEEQLESRHPRAAETQRMSWDATSTKPSLSDPPKTSLTLATSQAATNRQENCRTLASPLVFPKIDPRRTRKALYGTTNGGLRAIGAAKHVKRQNAFRTCTGHRTYRGMCQTRPVFPVGIHTAWGACGALANHNIQNTNYNGSMRLRGSRFVCVGLR